MTAAHPSAKMHAVIVTLMLLVPLIGAAFGIALYERREQQRVAAGGLSNERPGCARCLYPLGGWSTSHCPECGHDAAAGQFVRIGPKRAPIALMILVWIGFMVIGLPWFVIAAMWLLRAEHVDTMRLMVPADELRFQVIVETQVTYLRMPQRVRATTTIRVEELDAHVVEQHGEQRVIATWVAHTAESLPNSSDLARAFNDALGGTQDPLAQERATDLLVRARSARDPLTVNFFGGAMLTAPPPCLWASGGKTDEGDNALLIAGIAITLYTMMGVLIPVYRVKSDPGSPSRPVAPGEWTQPGGSETPRAQQ